MALLGGQFKSEMGGQFESATHGQFKSAQGGQFDRILQSEHRNKCRQFNSSTSSRVAGTQPPSHKCLTS